MGLGDLHRELTTVSLDHRAQPRRLAADGADCLAESLGTTSDVFFLFSNRLGCLGSLVVSAVVTLLLLLALGIL